MAPHAGSDVSVISRYMSLRGLCEEAAMPSLRETLYAILIQKTFTLSRRQPTQCGVYASLPTLEVVAPLAPIVALITETSSDHIDDLTVFINLSSQP